MTRSTLIAAVTLLLASAAGAEPAGFTALGLEAPHHGRLMVGAVWYPAGEGGVPTPYAEKPVFEGMIVAEGAAVEQGTHPVVLLSHGMGGESRSLAWLGTALAQRGAVVIAVNHPNSTWQDFDLGASLAHWTRVQDLTLAYDAVRSDPRFAPHLDESRVMAAGFSFGGWTALSFAGLRGDHGGYVAHCAEYGAASRHCDDMMRAEVGLTEVSAEEWNADYSDGRITRAVAIDPGLIWGVTVEGAAGVDIPVRLIGLGAGDDRLLATDFDASGLVDLLPGAAVNRMVPGVHFTAMPLCKPAGAEILAEERDDPVCTDPEGTDRAAIHARIIELIAGDLGL